MFGILFEGTYLLVDYLGSGFHAAVQLVRHVKTGELFARKMNFRSSPMAVTSMLEEIENTPNLPGTTAIHSSHFYPLRDQETTTTSDSGCGHFAIIMNYVNGGTVHQLLESLNYTNGHLDQPQKFPDHFLWKMLYQMIETMLTIALNRITHGDSHLANWLLQWTPDSDLPDVVLADFGLAEAHDELQDIIPLLSDPGVQAHGERWLNQQETKDLRYWYKLVMRDMQQVFRALAVMIIQPFASSAASIADPHHQQIVTNYVTALMHERETQRLVQNHAEGNLGCFGTSALLLKTMWRLFQATSIGFDRQQPLATAARQIQELRDIQRFAHQQFLHTRLSYRPGMHETDMEQARPDDVDDTPALFDTAEELMPFRAHPDADSPDQEDPSLSERDIGIHEECILRYGQYEVVKILEEVGKEIRFEVVPMEWMDQQ